MGVPLFGRHCLPQPLLSRFADHTDFVPRWSSGNWSQGHGWAHIGSDLAVAAAFLSIATLLAIYAACRRRVFFSAPLWLGVAFLTACAATHLLDAMMFTHPAYRVLSLMKVVTAVAAWGAFVALLRVLPRGLRLASAQDDNVRLAEEIQHRRRVESALAQTRDALEQQRAALVVRERRMRGAMRAAGACAVTWEVDLNRIVWESGAADALESMGLPGSAAFSRWDDILLPPEAALLREAAARAIASGAPMEVELRTRSVLGFPGMIRLSASPDPRVAGGSPTMTGMFRVLRATMPERSVAVTRTLALLDQPGMKVLGNEGELSVSAL